MLEEVFPVELKRHVLVNDAISILKEGMLAANPYIIIKNNIQIRDNTVLIRGQSFQAKKIHVIGFGKASMMMLKGLTDVLSDKIHGGVVIHNGEPGKIGNVEILRGNHPLPGTDTLFSSKRLLQYLTENVSEEDLTLVLISGGGSAMFEVPEDEVSIDTISEVTRLLMLGGADIYELNTVRKALSRVKGGKLLNYIRGTVVSLIISDVIGDDPSVIASGPTTFEDKEHACEAIGILNRKGIWNSVSLDLKKFLLDKCQNINSIKYGSSFPQYRKVVNYIVGNNYECLRKMREKAISLGYNSFILTPYLKGEAKEVAKVLASIIKASINLGEPLNSPFALLVGGESTVTVRGKGVGGRNQELCLSLLIELKEIKSQLVAICIGSDGIDGNSPSAGAIITNNTYEKAKVAGLTPEDYLVNNDSYTFFDKLGLTIKTGPTGTNVNDFIIILGNSKKQ